MQGLTPDFSWREYFKALNVDPGVAFNVDQPKFMQEFERQLQETSLADWKTYLTWQVLSTAAPIFQHRSSRKISLSITSTCKAPRK